MANIPIYDLTDTWNNVATTFDAIKINVTDTNSAAGSKLLNLQVGASPKFTVQKDGAVALTGAVTGATSITMNGALSGATTISGSSTATVEQLTVTKTTANAPAISSTGYSLTGSDATSLVDLAGTWDTTGAPTAIKLNITENSATPSVSCNLLDLQRGGVSQCKVSRSGQLTLTGGVSIPYQQRISLSSVAQMGSTLVSGYSIAFYIDTTNPVAQIQNVVSMFPSLQIGGGTTSSNHPVIIKDGNNTLALQNGTTAQTFNLYSTSSSSNANYERLSLISQAAGAFRIVTQKAGTGSAQALELGTDGTTRLTIETGGRVVVANDLQIGSSSNQRISNPSTNTMDLLAGGSQMLRLTTDGWAMEAWRSGNGLNIATKAQGGNSDRAGDPIVVDVKGGSGSANAGAFVVKTAYSIASGTTGHTSEESFRIRTLASGSYLASFGGTTSSFPAFKRSSATLLCRLADDSANAAFESASLKTDAPAGGTAATWKLGAVATVSPTSPDRTIEVDIGGTIYYIHAKTTNN